MGLRELESHIIVKYLIIHIYCQHTLSIIVEVLYLETAVPNTKDFTTDSVTEFRKLSKLLLSTFFFQASVSRWRFDTFVSWSGRGRWLRRSQTFVTSSWSGRWRKARRREAFVILQKYF